MALYMTFHIIEPLFIALATLDEQRQLQAGMILSFVAPDFPPSPRNSI